ncbi:hypothetical protein SteCoe_35442 [Stentor coeruleus]|uniref:EF-hand domain-containing protein n=1 Tax=Stentor coeruleus TaxID=5963 RepID=A0A1R2ASD8_9CILI|nr:hypothetical protein SteCoe_35442 [Stentor coeruleus]
MGCTACKGSDTNTLESGVFADFEKNIGFERLKAIEIDRILHRYCTFLKMSKTQMAKAIREMNVSLENHSDFIKWFYDGDSYLVKRLNCLGILLGQGDTNEKIKLLFQNFDEDASGTLSIIEIENMVSEIVFVSCLAIPSYTLSLHPNNPNLRSYASKLSMLKSGMTRHFTTLIMDESIEISQSEFSDCFKNKKILNLLSTSRLRMYGASLYEDVIKPADIIMASLDNPETLDTNIVRRISIVSPNRKKIQFHRSSKSTRW